MNRRFISGVLFTMAFGISSAAVAAEELQADPWEGFNRSMFVFNETLDEYILLPVAKGYQFVAPGFVETGVSNFFGNLGDVGTLANNVFQAKIADAASDLSRILFNTFIGLGGLIDVASPMGIEKHDEDFGQTLGYWGVDTGPYLVLPFFGPSNVRDGLSLVPDTYLDPLYYLDDDEARIALYGLRVVDQRAALIESEKLISGDRYSFIRDAYLQRREFLVNDGEISENFEEDNF